MHGKCTALIPITMTIFILAQGNPAYSGENHLSDPEHTMFSVEELAIIDMEVLAREFGLNIEIHDGVPLDTADHLLQHLAPSLLAKAETLVIEQSQVRPQLAITVTAKGSDGLPLQCKSWDLATLNGPAN